MQNHATVFLDASLRWHDTMTDDTVIVMPAQAGIQKLHCRMILHGYTSICIGLCLCFSGMIEASALSSPDNPNARVESQLSAAEQEAAAINRSLYSLSH